MSPVFEPTTGRYLNTTLLGRPHRLYLEEAGQGIPLLCLHTAGSDTRQYRGLMNDKRADAWDERADYTVRAQQTRRDAKAARVKDKVKRKERRQRRDALMRQGKEIKSAMRRARHRTAVTFYRALYITGLWRGELPGGTGKD